MQNLIFDLDGTIIDSSCQILKCLNEALIECGINDRLNDKAIIGPPIRKILKNKFPNFTNEEKEKIEKVFRRKYDYPEKDLTSIYDICSLVFEEIKKYQNIMLYLCTYKPYKPTYRILNNFGLYNIFYKIYCSDHPFKFETKKDLIDFIIKSNELDRNKTVYIGDTIGDLKSSSENRIKFVGVNWGYEKDKEYLKRNSNFWLESYSDFTLFLKTVLEI